MKILKYTLEQQSIFGQLADLALKGAGLQADPVVQQLKALLATATDEPNSKESSIEKENG